MIYYQSSPSWWIIKALCESKSFEIRGVRDYVIKEIGGDEKDILRRIKRLIKSEYIETTYEEVNQKLWGDGTGLQIKEKGQQLYLANQKIVDRLTKSIEQIIKKDKIDFYCRSEKDIISDWSGGIYYSSVRSGRDILYAHLSSKSTKKSFEELTSVCAYNLLPLVGKSRYQKSSHWTHRLFVVEFEKRCRETKEGKRFFERMKKEIATKTLSCIFDKEVSLNQNNLDFLIAHEHPIVRLMSKALINQNEEVYA